MEADEIRVSKVANVLLKDIDRIITDILESTCEDYKRSLDEFSKLIEQFQPCPQLLDGTIKSVVDRLAAGYIEQVLIPNGDSNLGNAIGIILYNYAKIRGIKTISNCMKSDIYLITKLLQKLDTTQIWQERFFLLAWLSVLVLAPFPLDRIGNDVSEKIYNISSYYLDYSGKENDASSILMARFLSRNDSGYFLEKFFQENLTRSQWEKKSTFTKIGILATTNFLLKISTYKSLSAVLEMHFNLIISNLEACEDTKTMKLYVKNMGKLSLLFLNSGEFEKIEEIVSAFLGLLGHKDTVIRYSLARQFSKLAVNLNSDFREELVNNILEEFEIKDLSMENPGSLQLDLKIDPETINIEKFHGILLTLAEFTRTKALPSKSINSVLSVLNKTFFVEQHRLTFSMGSNVRDASCFVAWALAKKYKTSEIHLEGLILLFKRLIIVSCYDRDLMIRRASAACIQELIGRHGDVILGAILGDNPRMNEFKIRLIETLDYSALSQLNRAYEISVMIPSISEGLMKDDFIEHLLHVGITSWNYEIRKQSSSTLFDFLKNTNVDKFVDGLILGMKDVPAGRNISNGLMYAIGTLLPLYSNFDNSQFLSDTLDSIVYDYHKDPFYKGEEIIYLITALKKKRHLKYQITDAQYDLIFNIIRQNDMTIRLAFVELATVLDNIPEKYNEKWIYYIQNGNITAAEGIGYANDIVLRSFDKLMGLVGDPSVDAKLRSSIIASISLYVSKYSDNMTSELLIQIIKNLDDYTITNQGDVGSFIRESAIKLISTNLELFKSDSKEVLFEVEKRLARLSGEVMDRIRLKALKLLLKLKQWQKYYIDYAQSNDINYDADKDDDLLFTSLDDYFSLLLRIHNSEYLTHLNDEKISLISLEFWRGYSFSGGAIHANDITVNSAVHSFFLEYEGLSNDQRILVLNKLLGILKVDSSIDVNKNKYHIDRHLKSQNSCLRFWVNLLDLNLELPSNFKLSGLFVRVFNLHLNTSNITRLQNAIKIFVILYLEDQTQFKKAKERLNWISTKHPISTVRSLAEEGLVEIEWELENSH